MSIREEQKIVENMLKEDLLKENPNTRLKSALFGNDDKIVSFAIGTPENPMGEDVDDETNNKLRKKFEILLKRMREEYKELNSQSYIKTKGKYGNTEHSYFIINPNLDEMKDLFKLFNQKSSIFAIRNDSGDMEFQYWERNENSDFVLRDRSRNIETMEDFEDFFTSLHDFKFNINFDIFNEAYSEVYDYLEECGKNSDYYDRLKSQVYGKNVHGFERMMNRKFMYETPEMRREREERTKGE
jgi:hypothetical protein